MIKVSLILLCGLATAALLQRRSAALRHWVLAAAIVCAGATPLLERIVPAMPVPVHPSFFPSLFGRTMEPLTLIIPVHETRPLEDLTVVQSRSGFESRQTVLRLLEGGWLTGAAIGLLMLAIGLGRLALLAARSRNVTSGRWAQIAEQVAREYGLRRSIRVLEGDLPTLLVTWGVWRPKVFVPAGARSWPEERIRVVLAHELAHVARGDWITHMAAELLRCVYWFNPLVWMAYRQLRLESEQACDDAVLALGIGGLEYAAHLVDLARSFKTLRTAMVPAPAMARPSSLERRVRAMLNAQRNHRPITRTVGAAVALALVAITIPLAGLGASAQSSTAAFSGLLIDAVGRIMPDATLVLTNTQTRERREARSDATAHFAFAALPAGDYTLEASVPGFATSQGRVTLEAGQSLVRDVALQVGEVHETFTVVASSTPRVSPTVGPPPINRTKANQQSANACTPPVVGGEIIPPRKLVDKKPIYPGKEAEAGVSGTVEMDARIGVDGLVKDVHLTAPAAQGFADAMATAIQGWRFTTTLLDCVPVEVSMHVSGNFIAQ